MQNRDFRIALSHAINRKRLQESAFLGLGEPRNAVAAPWHPYFPGDEVTKKNLEFDRAKANEMLDAIGLDKKNAEGYAPLSRHRYPRDDRTLLGKCLRPVG